MRMKLHDYLDEELTAALIHTIAGMLAGFVSFSAGRPELGMAAGLGVLALTYAALRYGMKLDKKPVWFLSNGVFLFLFTWLVVWTVFHTLRAWSTLG